MKNKKVIALVESALMVTIATILSLIKIIDLPYGGSVTIASMLPVIIIAYRHGFGWGFGAGLVFSIIQQLLGLSTLSYATSWQSVLAIVLLDYIIAFAVTCLGGVFRKCVKNQAVGLMLGSVLVCVLRYVCHVISGATVWVGISIPTAAALNYSFIYNATYMIPETIITAVIAVYIGSTINFRVDAPTRMVAAENSSSEGKLISALSGLAITGALIYDTIAIFSELQNAETGEFNITQIANVEWTPVIVVTALAVVIAAVLLIAKKALNNKKAQ